MNKFTDGPWELGYGSGLSGDVISWQCLLDEEAELCEIPIRHGKEAVIVLNHHKENSETAQANANLIAAAPDMYEALKYQELCMDSPDGDLQTFLHMRDAALAKAEGKL